MIRLAPAPHHSAKGFHQPVRLYLALCHRERGLTCDIVLVAAGGPSTLDARQVRLGADIVLRDPVRAEVISAYLEKFQHSELLPAARSTGLALRSARFAGGTIALLERSLKNAERSTILTMREVQLVQALLEAEGSVVTYDSLYSEILERRFRGETSNMRVLLGKLAASFGRVGLKLRDWVKVIPKTGYRYTAPPDRRQHPDQPAATYGAGR